LAWLGEARLGEARLGKARHGMARQGTAWLITSVGVKACGGMVGEPKTHGRCDSMKKINVRIEGTSPLLINRFLEKQITAKIKKKSGEQKDIPVEEKLYLLDGKPYIPARYFVGSLVDAAKQFKIAGKQKATYSKYVGATIRIEPEAILIEPGKWEPFSISAVIPSTGGRVMVTRPQFNKWAASFEILCDDDEVSVDTMEQITEQAGKFTGIGDWRPQKKGAYGKFRIVKFEESAV
jgi:hypothetical protein